VFSGSEVGLPEVAEATHPPQLPIRRRQLLTLFLRHLLEGYDSHDVALARATTLFDAVASKTSDDLLATSATPAALARVALMCSPLSMLDYVTCDIHLACANHFEMTTASPEDVLHMEKVFFSLLGGRMSLASPMDWACMFIHRLYALATPEGVLRDVLEWILPVVEMFALQVIEVVGATSRLPPRVLGVCAVVRACVVTGWMDHQDLRPEWVSPEVWSVTFLANLNGDAHGNLPILTSEVLAEAACCGTEDVRRWTFEVMNEVSLLIREMHNGV